MSENKNTENAEAKNNASVANEVVTVENKKQDEKQPESPQKKPEKQNNGQTGSVAKKASIGLIYILLIILAIAAGGAANYLWELQQQQQQQLAENITSINGLQSQLGQLNSQILQNASTTEMQEKSLQQLTLNLAETTEVSQQAMQMLQQDQRGWALAEIDYLLRMAHRRLQVARDINGAIAALQGADSRILQLGDLRLFKIRKQLHKDIAALNAIKQVDISGIAMNIDEDIALLADLPFKSLETEIAAQLAEDEQIEPPVDQSFVGSVIDTVKQIGDIKIYRHDVKVANSADNQKIVLQSMQSHLLGARLAALSFNSGLFDYEIDQSINLLNRHYDLQDNRVSQLVERLTAYKDIQLESTLPELTQAWELLQKELTVKEEFKESAQ